MLTDLEEEREFWGGVDIADDYYYFFLR